MLSSLAFLALAALASPRWAVDRAGITWQVDPSAAPHQDNIETSGEQCSLILSYGSEAGGVFTQTPFVVWPMLRTLPNDTHASLRTNFPVDTRPMLTADGEQVAETLKSVRLDGEIHIATDSKTLSIERVWLASPDKPFAIERLRIRNRGSRPVKVALAPPKQRRTTDADQGLEGAYAIEALPWHSEEASLRPGESRLLAIYYTAHPTSRPAVALPKSPLEEEARRQAFVKQIDDLLHLDTPDQNVNRMFAFAKIRAAESLFRTRGGLVHSPGGGAYYAAIWANDQAEYANPLFGYLGYSKAREAAETSFAWFARYMNPEYRPIPSSIVAEGTSYWNGAGDRGDMAMIAYGASRYALARGDRAVAEKLWPLIRWSLEYLERKKNAEGVIPSDHDELEGRFPAGKANLNTSCLAYDGLLSAASLAETLGEDDLAPVYRARAASLRDAIARYFDANVEGFETYRYYEGNDVLRAWIVTPLTVRIFDRAPGTIDALLSPRLWTDDGLASLAGNTTFWDRSTLYGFRGAFAAGATERIFPRFLAYTNRRLTGEHVPYAVEAYPEGNQRHLSAESALYVRAVSEGLFGLRPTGLNHFELNPRLPRAWSGKGMTLRNIAIAGGTVDIRVRGEECEVAVHGQPKQSFKLGRPREITIAPASHR